jgi:ABC-type histidine transport system ATPase subunit
MLTNPFAPSEIVSEPHEFFGRSDELRTLERALQQGSVAILGAIGIGKSSLLARARLLMEGLDSPHQSRSVVAVGDRDVKTVDNAARLLLESFTHVDEAQHKLTLNIGPILQIESGELCRNFVEGRHLAVLKRLVEKENLSLILSDKEFLLLAIDEADKCPVALARLIRAIATHTQQQGVKGVQRRRGCREWP